MSYCIVCDIRSGTSKTTLCDTCLVAHINEDYNFICEECNQTIDLMKSLQDIPFHRWQTIVKVLKTAIDDPDKQEARFELDKLILFMELIRL